MAMLCMFQANRNLLAHLFRERRRHKNSARLYVQIRGKSALALFRLRKDTVFDSAKGVMNFAGAILGLQ
jgi:hypothetical protein